jgi:hypothetical protein
MSKRRLVITAVLAGQSQSQVAVTYGVSQGWISALGRIRTCNLLIRSQVLYPLSYERRCSGEQQR